MPCRYHPPAIYSGLQKKRRADGSHFFVRFTRDPGIKQPHQHMAGKTAASVKGTPIRMNCPVLTSWPSLRRMPQAAICGAGTLGSGCRQRRTGERAEAQHRLIHPKGRRHAAHHQRYRRRIGNIIHKGGDQHRSPDNDGIRSGRGLPPPRLVMMWLISSIMPARSMPWITTNNPVSSASVS